MTKKMRKDEKRGHKIEKQPKRGRQIERERKHITEWAWVFIRNEIIVQRRK